MSKGLEREGRCAKRVAPQRHEGEAADVRTPALPLAAGITLPPQGATIRIFEHRLLMLGVAADALVLGTSSAPHHLFLLPDGQGVPALVRFDQFQRMLDAGVASVEPFTPSSGGDTSKAEANAEKLGITCDMLDAAGVPNGTKSIAIFLHRFWTEELTARFGPALNAHTVKRWRARMPEPPS